MQYLKGVFGFALMSTLVACAPLHQHQSERPAAQIRGHSTSLATRDLKQALARGIENERWVQKLYKKYQSKGGYKALAIASPNVHYIDALGYSSEMLTAEYARERALQWCRESSKGIAPCIVLLEQSAEPPYQVSQVDIDKAPPQLKSYGSVLRFLVYEKGSGHKAFALATESDQTFWMGQQVSKKTARRKTLSLCETYKNNIASSCEILRSE